MPETLRKRDRRGAVALPTLAILWSMATVAAQPGADTQRALEAALHREVVLGDLKGALEQYRALAAAPGTPRAIAARAWFQTGLCLEKQGRAADAVRAYNRVAGEFAGEMPTASWSRARLSSLASGRPGPRNLDFSEGVPGKAPPGWFVPALPKDANYMAELRREGCRGGRGCAVVMVPANAPRPFSQLMQTFSAAPYRGAKVRLRAWLRVEPGGAEDRGQMWLSVDRANRGRGFYDNMDDRPVRSGEWTLCEISGAIDDDATFIDIGVISIGRSRVWVDSVSFEIIR
jgi:hypothetical protein